MLPTLASVFIQVCLQGQCESSCVFQVTRVFWAVLVCSPSLQDYLQPWGLQVFRPLQKRVHVSECNLCILHIISVAVPSLSCVRLFAAPHTVAGQAPLSVEFSRQEYWSGLPFPFPGDLPDPGMEPLSPQSPALRGGLLSTVRRGSPNLNHP